MIDPAVAATAPTDPAVAELAGALYAEARTAAKAAQMPMRPALSEPTAPQSSIGWMRTAFEPEQPAT